MIIVQYKTLPFYDYRFSTNSETDLFISSPPSESVKLKTGHFEVGPFHSFWNNLRLEVVNKAGASASDSCHSVSQLSKSDSLPAEDEAWYVSSSVLTC